MAEITLDALLLPPPLNILEGASVFLDFDGTLVPLTDIPEAVTVDEALRKLLIELNATLGGRLAIVSGRSVDALRNRFGLKDMILAGSHGLEYALPGEPTQAPPRLGAVDDVEALLTAFVSDKPGLLVERKTLSVGLHYRKAPQWAEACRELAERLAHETGLFLQTGKMLYELRPGGADKGSAISALMLEEPMSAGTPLFIGDDVTDEDGFAAAARMGGNGILVGEARDTLAHWRLEHVEAVRHYLTESLVHLSGKVPSSPSAARRFP